MKVTAIPLSSESTVERVKRCSGDEVKDSTFIVGKFRDSVGVRVDAEVQK